MRVAVRAVVGALGAWVSYAWLPHLGTPAAVWRGPAHRRRVALTFDDGPEPRWTPRVLDLLAARRVRATFFVVGARAARTPGLLREMAAAGHELANHSWSHPSLWFCPPKRTLIEVVRTHELLADLTGRPPRHFRPPWGMVNLALPSALARVGERCVFWSLQPEGLRVRPAGVQVSTLLRRVHPGAIVDLHDAEGLPGAPARLLAALPAMLDGLRVAGWELVTVGELLDDA